jgi:hypothetical protein
VPEGSTTMKEPKPFAERRRFLVTGGILIGGALVVRAAFLGCRMVLGGDEVHYAESLQRFLEGRFIEGVSDYWSFFYPLLAVPLGKLYGNAEQGLRFLSIICGGAVIIPAMLIAKRLWGDRTAFFAGILIALHPILIQFSTSALTESLHAFLLMTALYLFIRFMRDGSSWIPVISGIVLGLAYMTRQEAQFVLILFVIVILSARGTLPLGKRFVRAAVLVVFFVLTVLPSVSLLRAKTGQWTTGSKAAVNLSSPLIWEDSLERERYVYSLDETGTERRIETIGRGSTLKILLQQRHAIVSRYLPNLNRGFARLPELLASPFLLLLVPLGLFGRIWRRSERLAEILLLLVGLFPFLLYAIFRINTRYLVPFLPLYLLWAACGCEVLLSWLRESVSSKPLLAAVVLFVILTSLVPFTVRRYVLLRRSEPVEYREIGRWIRENGGEGARVLAPSGWSVGYYAGNPLATYIPWTDPEGLLYFAAYHEFEYLVLDERYIENARPQLTPLLRDEPYPGMETVHIFRSRSGGRILLFRLETAG